GPRPMGPLMDSFLARVGPVYSHAIPLAIVSLALLGYALRERVAGYAFVAGLFANLTVTGGYAVAVVAGGGDLSATEYVRLLQLATVVAAFWVFVFHLFAGRLSPAPGETPPLLS